MSGSTASWVDADPRLQLAFPADSGTVFPPSQEMLCPDESETTKITFPVGGCGQGARPQTEAVTVKAPATEEAGVKFSHVCEAAGETGCIRVAEAAVKPFPPG